MVIGWSFTINPQTHKDVYLLHLVTQNIVNETSILFSTKDLYYFQQKKNTEKLRNLEKLTSSLSKYCYADSLIKQGFQKALSITQKDLRKPKKPSNENILPFITPFNPSNPNTHSTIKSSFICLKNFYVSSFHNINLIQSKRQPPNLKKLLTKVE